MEIVLARKIGDLGEFVMINASTKVSPIDIRNERNVLGTIKGGQGLLRETTHIISPDGTEAVRRDDNVSQERWDYKDRFKTLFPDDDRRVELSSLIDTEFLALKLLRVYAETVELNEKLETARREILNMSMAIDGLRKREDSD